ncbi:MAG: hypothetical protein AB1758_31855 [Candidatus Eremiobacterota bacterium]
MLRERPPLTPLQVVLALWIVGTVLYAMVRAVDVRYYVLIRPAAVKLSRSLDSARANAVIKTSEGGGGQVTLRFRPRGGPYTQLSVDQDTVLLSDGVFLVNSFGQVPQGDELTLDHYGDYASNGRKVEEVVLTVVSAATPAVATLRLKSGQAARWE